MNFAEARSLAIAGHRVRAIDMQPEAFVYYDFAGLRININGNSSAWSPKPHDEEVEWVDVPYVEVDPMDIPQYAQMVGRAMRGAGGKTVLTEGFIEPVGEVMIINPNPWNKAAPDMPPGIYEATFDVTESGRIVPDMVKPVAPTPQQPNASANKWGAKPDPSPANVGKWGAPKRDAWGRKID